MSYKITYHPAAGVSLVGEPQAADDGRYLVVELEDDYSVRIAVMRADHTFLGAVRVTTSRGSAPSGEWSW